MKTFNDIAHHLELKVERFEAIKFSDLVYMAESSSRKASNIKHKRGYKNNQKGGGSDPDQKKLDVKKHPEVGMLARKMTNLR